MSLTKTGLDALLASAVLSSGVERQDWLTKVRQYLNTTPPDQLKREVSLITSIPELVFLQAAGVPAFLQPTFLFTYQQRATR
jgi:uncharacterized protein YgfB (UPF0149 family)